MSTPQEKNIKQLNSFLRGERSAVETYNQALDKVDDNGTRATLQSVKASHLARVQKLESKIRALGGSPSMDSGPWGTFAKAVEGGAKIFGTGAAISALEEGEDHGLSDYKGDLSDLTPDMQRFITSEILPEQRETHATMSRLQDRV